MGRLRVEDLHARLENRQLPGGPSVCAAIVRLPFQLPEFFKTFINGKILAKGKDTCDKIMTITYREFGSALLSSRF